MDASQIFSNRESIKPEMGSVAAAFFGLRKNSRNCNVRTIATPQPTLGRVEDGIPQFRGGTEGRNRATSTQLSNINCGVRNRVASM
jgi:hypothetical protein